MDDKRLPLETLVERMVGMLRYSLSLLEAMDTTATQAVAVEYVGDWVGPPEGAPEGPALG